MNSDKPMTPWGLISCVSWKQYTKV